MLNVNRGALTRGRRRAAISAAVFAAVPLLARCSYAQTAYTYTPSSGTLSTGWTSGAQWSTNGQPSNTAAAAPVSASTTELNFGAVVPTASITTTNDITTNGAPPFLLNIMDLSGIGPATSGTGTVSTNEGTLNIGGSQLEFVANGINNPLVNLTGTGANDGTGTLLFNNEQYFVNNNINLANDTTFQSLSGGTATFDFTGQFSGAGQIIKQGAKSNLIIGNFLAASLANSSFTYTGNMVATAGTITIALGATSVNQYSSFYTNGTLELNGGTFDMANANVAFGYISVGTLNAAGAGSLAITKSVNGRSPFVLANLVPENLATIQFPSNGNPVDLSIVGPGGGNFGTFSAGSGALLAGGTGSMSVLACTGNFYMGGIGTTVFPGTATIYNGGSAISSVAGMAIVAPNSSASNTLYTVPMNTGANANWRAYGGGELKIDNGGTGTVVLQANVSTGNTTNNDGGVYFGQGPGSRGALVFGIAQGASSLGTSDKIVVLANQPGSGTATINNEQPLADNVMPAYFVAADAGAGSLQSADFVTYVGVGSTTDMGIVSATTAYNGAYSLEGGAGSLTNNNTGTLTNYATAPSSGNTGLNIVEINDSGSPTTGAIGAGSFSAYDLRIDNDTYTLPGGVSGSSGSLTLTNTNSGLILNGATITGGGTLVFGATPYIYTSLANGTISSNISGASSGIIKFGPGTLYLAGSGAGSFAGVNNVTTVEGGALDVGTIYGGGALASDGHNLPQGNLNLLDGVLEGNGLFSRALGTSGSQVQILSAGGFAAAGGPLTVNLGGSSAPLTWGTTSFLLASAIAAGQFNINATTFSDYVPLMFGAATANNQVNFQNPIVLGANSPFYWRDIYVTPGAGGDSALISGVISDTAGAIAQHGILKDGSGTLFLSGANSYSGQTQISRGTLIAESATALGAGATANVTAGANTNLEYQAQGDTQLAIGGNLSLAGGNILGVSIGDAATSSEINVAGNATASGAITVNLFGIPSAATPVSGTFNLLHGAGASSSISGATYTLAPLVHGDTNFILSGPLLENATDLQISVTAQAPLTAAYWTGGLTGATNVWSASDGTANSNWAATSGGSDQALVPGPGAAVYISASSVSSAPTAVNNTVLGDNMTISSLTIQDTVNGLGILSDGYTLTINPGTGNSGITMNGSVPASSIAASVALGSSQIWTNNSANPLTVSGSISGAFTLTTAGTGVIQLSGTNFYTGTTINSGTLAAQNIMALGSTSSAVTLSGGALDLQTDFSILPYATVVSANSTISSDKATASSPGITHTLGTLAIGAQTLTVAGGANVGSGTAGLAFGATTFSGTPIFNIVNPIGGGTTSLILSAVTNGANTGTIEGNGNFAQTGVWGNGSGGVTLDSTYTGTATLSQSNTFTGAVTVNGGTLAANTSIGALGAGVLNLNGGTLDFNATGGLSFSRNTTVGGNATIVSDKNAAGAGVTYTLGTLSIGANTLTVGGGVVSSGTAGLTFGVTTFTGAPTFTINKPTSGGTTLLTLGAIANSSYTATFKGGGNFAQTGVWGNGSGGIDLDSTYTGTLALSQANTLTGNVNINGGTLALQGGTGTPAANVLSAINAIYVGSAGAVQSAIGKLSLSASADTAPNLVNNGASLYLYSAGGTSGTAATVAIPEVVLALKSSSTAEVFNELYINDVAQPAGTYSASSEPAGTSVNVEGYFSGTGEITTLVPEPTALSLLGIGALGALGKRRRRCPSVDWRRWGP